jgi:DNA-binding MarR family transcriptional regulator
VITRTTEVAADPGLAEDLRSAVNRLSKRLRRTRAEWDLTSAETTVLAIASRRGPVGLTELALTEGMNPTMLSRVLRTLEGRSLVSRTVDPNDRRAALVDATPAGDRLYKRIRIERNDALAALFMRLEPRERVALADALPVLERLAEFLNQDPR